MTSKIDPSGINPAYPVASTNQSSQGFRDNFKAIQNALVQAKTENTLILGTTITISGDGIDDFTSTSIEVGNGNIPLEINLSTQSNVNSASYNTLTDIISFTVNQQGILTSLAKQPSLPVTDTTSIWKITRTPNDASYPNQNGILSFTYPTIQTNDAGRVISAGSVTISNIGLLGYSMNKGQILVGSSANLSTYLPVGLDNQVLVANSGSPSGLSWTTPTNGTVTDVTTGLGLLVNNSKVTPEIDLDIQALPDNNTFDGNLIFLSYDNGHSTTKWTSIQSQMLQSVASVGYIKKVQDDVIPTLGGNLNTNGFNLGSSGGNSLNIYSGTAGLNVSSTGNMTFAAPAGIAMTSQVLTLNGIQMPGSLPGSDGLALVANKDGKLFWQSFNSLTSVMGDNAIESTPNGNYVDLAFTPWRLPSINVSLGTKLLSIDTFTNTAGLMDMGSVVQGASSIQGVSYVAPSGNDTTGNGSFVAPYATVAKAMTISQNIVLLPGAYDETMTLSQVSTFSAMIPGSVTINNKFSAGSGTDSNYTVIYGVKFVGTVNSVTSAEYDSCSFSASTSLTVGSNLANLNNCTIQGTVTNTAGGTLTCNNCTSSYSPWTVSTSSDVDIMNSSELTVEHLGGQVELYNIVYCNAITSSANINIPSDSGTDGSSSTTSSNSLIMRNVSMSNNDGTWGVINKTGNCPFILQNVSRLATQDTLTGQRLEFANTDDDIGDQYLAATITGNYTIPGNTRVYDLTVNTASAFTISFNNETFNAGQYIRSMTVILRGTDTSAAFGTNVITWNGVTWNGGVAPGWNFASGKISVFTFLYINNVGWIGSTSMVTA